MLGELQFKIFNVWEFKTFMNLTSFAKTGIVQSKPRICRTGKKIPGKFAVFPGILF